MAIDLRKKSAGFDSETQGAISRKNWILFSEVWPATYPFSDSIFLGHLSINE